MRIYFDCKVYGDDGSGDLYVNDAKFKLKSGSEVTIDRQTTNYNINGNDLTMEWRNCYLWAIDDTPLDGNGQYQECLLGPDFGDLISRAKLVEINIEDEAPSDYFIKIKDWRVE